MYDDRFETADLARLRAHGLSAEEVRRQWSLLRRPPRYLHLDRPCTLGDGIRALAPDEEAACLAHFERQRTERLFQSFIPASGAASRMFRDLLHVRAVIRPLTRASLVQARDRGDGEAAGALETMAHLPEFAFYPEVTAALAQRGLKTGESLAQGAYAPVMDILLNAEGLDYPHRPKGLLPFHRYADETRTAFEEHLVERALLGSDHSSQARLHLTVAPEAQAAFAGLLESVRSRYERQYQTVFAVDFSCQATATDTVALGDDRNLFRDAEGRILLRPGGHGALLPNLDRLRGDIVFVKNIDNVAPDPRKPLILKWKKIMAGYLLAVQAQVHRHLAALAAGAGPRALKEALDYAVRELDWSPPGGGEARPEKLTEALARFLNRPLRVCGMVRNEGEPGGGPFWVRAGASGITRQIVEGAQIDLGDPAQQAVFKGATHFNPVDMVCGLRDWRGQSFDLARHVDPEAVIVTRKSVDGRDLLALEHPGLWNGGMADWITLLVEIPAATFNPVKTLNDLLREVHQDTGLPAGPAAA